MKLIELKDILIGGVELFWDNEPKENLIIKKYFGSDLPKMYKKYGQAEIDYLSPAFPYAGSCYMSIKLKGVK